jgi:5-carboxymethyl-2-hydroxymuconate isomerase
MTLETITRKYGIEIRSCDGDLRNVVDVLEDMFLKLSTAEYLKLMFEIAEEEKHYNLFDDARHRKYKGVE